MDEPTVPTGGVSPDAPPPSPRAPDTVGLLNRYAAGDTLTPKEFGTLGAHYAALGKPLPKEQRASALAAKSPGKRVAASAVFGSGPPPPPPAPGEPLAPADSPPADPALLADSARVLLGTLEARLSRKVQRTATKLGASKPEADRLGEAAKFDPTSKDLVCNSVGLVCRKHAVSGEYAPEISLLIGVGDIGFHFMGVLEELDELEKRAEARSQGTEVKANPSEAAP